MAEEEGVEPPRGLHLLSVFETDPFSHLGIPPRPMIIITKKFIFSIILGLFINR